MPVAFVAFLECSYEAVHGRMQGPGALRPVLDAAAALTLLGLQKQHVHPRGGIPSTAPAAASASESWGWRAACRLWREEEEFFHVWEGLPEWGGLRGHQHVLSALGDEQRVPAPPAPFSGRLFRGQWDGPVQLSGTPEGASAGQGCGLPAGGGGLGSQHAFSDPDQQLWAPTWNSPQCAAFFKVAAGHGGDPWELRGRRFRQRA